MDMTKSNIELENVRMVDADEISQVKSRTENPKFTTPFSNLFPKNVKPAAVWYLIQSPALKKNQWTINHVTLVQRKQNVKKSTTQVAMTTLQSPQNVMKAVSKNESLPKPNGMSIEMSTEGKQVFEHFKQVFKDLI